MNIRRAVILLFGLLLSLTLSGCSLFSSLFPAGPETATSTALELRLDTVLPGDVILRWDPAAVSLDSAEVSVDGSDPAPTITVVIRLSPHQP